MGIIHDWALRESTHQRYLTFTRPAIVALAADRSRSKMRAEPCQYRRRLGIEVALVTSNHPVANCGRRRQVNKPTKLARTIPVVAAFAGPAGRGDWYRWEVDTVTLPDRQCRGGWDWATATRVSPANRGGVILGKVGVVRVMVWRGHRGDLGVEIGGQEKMQ